MEPIQVTPYLAQRDLTGGHVTIRLTSANFESVAFRDGTVVLPFYNCFFERLTIVNEEEIEFKQISIAFFSCILPNIEIENITTKNITVGFYGSLVSGKIEHKNLIALDFNNCLTLSSMFVINVPKVQISYTRENFETNHWSILLTGFLQMNVHEIVNKPIRYHVYNPKVFHLSSNFDYQEEQFKPEVTIAYEPGTDHIETKIKGTSLEAFSISGSPNGNVSVENTRINSWYIYNFSPDGNVSFYSIEPIILSDKENKIGIHNSKLDGVEFDNVSFDSYPIISFYRTKFSKAIFTSCDFPEDYKTFSKFVEIENVHYPDRKPKNYDKAQYEIFLQLKKAVEERGNYYESQKFQAMAHDALRQIKSISWSDRLILKINSWSNNHALSVKRPFVGFIIFSIILYILYLGSIGRIFNSEDFDPTLIGYYFSFIDITHRIDFLVGKEEFTVWTLLIDYLGKLVFGFFIYQFITSFRKYGKRA
ncbi:hypothetical protein [Sphingobacterium psychroaquaticum]|uniref:Uncharacterized protein n=1 Tax=Sphingobacterium psychroaquaticum TaxID=561061 RepID=A0A1X7LEF9_9SPHI|nr:hypothetical protein [Sphingobacterium psychroaquaticum]SMG51642.1 hypothetical protein SAMN05660862_0008 [Sphingobacterium psychroaquaticum]